MNIEEIESKLNAIEELTKKLRELVSDAKVCKSEVTKMLISSAIKKYAASMPKIEVEIKETKPDSKIDAKDQ